MLKISIGSDHGGFIYKEAIKEHLKGKYEVIDVGTHIWYTEKADRNQRERGVLPGTG